MDFCLYVLQFEDFPMSLFCRQNAISYSGDYKAVIFFTFFEGGRELLNPKSIQPFPACFVNRKHLHWIWISSWRSNFCLDVFNF